MLRSVFLYGNLAEKYGKVHKLDVKSANEAFRALEANNPGFRNDIKKDVYYSIVRGEDVNGEEISKNQITMQYGKGDFHISPLVEGAKDTGLFMAILGAALIVAAFFIPVLSPWLMPLGTSLLIGGVGLMMTSTPENTDPDENKSFHFSGPTNTTEQGSVLPLVYGRMIVGATVISAGIKVESI